MRSSTVFSICCRLSVFIAINSLLLVKVVRAGNILAIFLFPAKSHYVIIEPIIDQLVSRGHHVTEYSPFVRREQHHTTTTTTTDANFVHIDIGQCFNLSNRPLTIDFFRSISNAGTYKALKAALDIAPDYGRIADCAPLVQLLRRRPPDTKKYDLVLTEIFNSEIPLLFAYTLGAPFVNIECTLFFSWRLTSDNWPSYMPISTERYDDWRLNGFFDRLRNSYATLTAKLMYDRLSSVARSDEAGKRLLGPSTPSVKEIAKNTSLTLAIAHSSLIDARPLPPSVADISGIHIKPAKSLPTDIEKFIQESEHGVIYFCMGSLVRASSFPENKKNAFLSAFSKIPQRVLWKWEQNELPNKTSNIMTVKWMPQRDILAHPKIKLFISHGGLLSITEAIYEGIPILGIPIFGDQRSALKAIEAAGAGEILDYDEISEQIVFDKIRKLLNESYRKNALVLSERFKDRPTSPLDTAVYWIEYVIRYKGAPHLRSPAVHLTWYRYLLLDIIAFLSIILVIILISTYHTFKLIGRLIFIVIIPKISKRKRTLIKKYN